MNILVSTLGSYGDVYPFIGLSVQLSRRGHNVTFLTNPFFEKLARKYDLNFVPIGTRQQYEEFSNHPLLFDPRKSLSVFFKTLIIPSIRPGYKQICERIQPDKTALVSANTVFAARLVQEKHKIPTITVHNIPMALRSAYELSKNRMFPIPDWFPLAIKRFYWWVADKAVLDPLICPELNAFRKELRLAPASRIMTKWSNSPYMVIGLFPPWFAHPQPDWPPETRLTGFPLFDEDQEAPTPPEISAFVDEDEPPIVFMPASLMQQAEQFFNVAVQACQEIGQRAILLSRYKHQIPDHLPEGIQHFEYIPLKHILPRVKALVHQGGIGTCAQALRSGIPQLIRPMAYDQFDNAWRLKQLGVGDWINPEDWQVSTVTVKLIEIISSSRIHDRCQAVSRKFEGISPLIETCKLIESAQ